MNSGYLNEKELYILYKLSRNKFISTLEGVFKKDPETITVSFKEDSSEKFSKQILEEIDRSKKFNLTYGNIILQYLLDLGNELDEDYSVSCNALYSLYDGGFLCGEYSDEFDEYLQEDLNGRKKEKYNFLSKKEKKEVDELLIDAKKGKKISFGKYEYKPVREYIDVIENGNGDKRFIELVKTLTEGEGASLNTEECGEFLRIYYENNRKISKEKGISKMQKNSQSLLSKKLFSHMEKTLNISDTDKVNLKLKEYLNLYKNDKLQGKSRKGLTGKLFNNSLVPESYPIKYGFKKQKDMLIKHIKEVYDKFERIDLEIISPFVEPEYIGDIKKGSFRIETIKEEEQLFLFIHTMLVLESENILSIKDLNFGSSDIFDLYDKGFIFDVILNIDKLFNDVKKEYSNKKEIEIDIAETKDYSYLISINKNKPIEILPTEKSEDNWGVFFELIKNQNSEKLDDKNYIYNKQGKQSIDTKLQKELMRVCGSVEPVKILQDKKGEISFLNHIKTKKVSEKVIKEYK